MKSKWNPTLMLGPLKVSSGLCRRNEPMHYLHSCAHFCHTDNSTKKGTGKSTSVGMSCMKYMGSEGVAWSGSGRKTWTWPAWRTWSWGYVQGQSGREELELPNAFQTLVTINRFMVSRAVSGGCVCVHTQVSRSCCTECVVMSTVYWCAQCCALTGMRWWIWREIIARANTLAVMNIISLLLKFLQ